MTNRFTSLPLPPARLIFPLVGALLMIGAPSIHADLLVYEGFDYPSGELIDQAGGKGWSDAWHGGTDAHAHGSVAADSLKVPQAIATAGGHMVTIDGDSPMMRGLSNPLFNAAGVTWISLLARNDSGQTDSTYSFLKFSVSGGGDDGSIRIGKGYYGKNWEIGFGSQSRDLSVAADNNAVLIVLRIEHTGKPGNDSIQVFANPAITSVPTSPASTITRLTLKPLDQVLIQSGNGVKHFSYDEIRVGTTFADVAPAAPTDNTK